MLTLLQKGFHRAVRLRAELFAVLGAFLLFMFLFDMVVLALMLSPWGILALRKTRDAIASIRKKQYMDQFQDFLLSYSMAASAGKTGTMAFRYSLEELKAVYPEQGAFLKDLSGILAQSSMDRDVHEVFCEYASRSDREEIQVFGEMLLLISRKGGDFCKLTAHCSDLIREKMKLEKDREVILAKQKMELQIITVLPVVLLAMMRSLNPDYLQGLVSTPVGIAGLLVSLALIGLAIVWGMSICSTENL